MPPSQERGKDKHRSYKGRDNIPKRDGNAIQLGEKPEETKKNTSDESARQAQAEITKTTEPRPLPSEDQPGKAP